MRACLASHSLQMVVSDGMKEVKAIAIAIAKATKFTTLLHSSSKVRDIRPTLGLINLSLAAKNTRWNSSYHTWPPGCHRNVQQMWYRKYCVFSPRMGPAERPLYCAWAFFWGNRPHRGRHCGYHQHGGPHRPGLKNSSQQDGSAAATDCDNS